MKKKLEIKKKRKEEILKEIAKTKQKVKSKDSGEKPKQKETLPELPEESEDNFKNICFL